MKESHCASCNALIVWVMTEKGRRMPVDHGVVAEGTRFRVGEDGIAHAVTIGLGHVSHFATCPNAGKHRRSKR